MSALGHFMKKERNIRYYGRYFDDFIIAHPNKEYLKSLIPVISNYLKDELKLKLRPKKIYSQHYTKGVKFLGTVIKPNRIYIVKRNKGNFYNGTQKHNHVCSLAISEVDTPKRAFKLHEFIFRDHEL
jgi:RNA-directed DNA polymerase